MTEVFGTVFDGGQVERAATTTLKLWMDTYLTEIELQADRDNPLPRPRSWTVVQKVTQFKEDQLPTVMLLSEGLDGTPRREAGGVYRATWKLTVVVVVSARDVEAANRLNKLYGAAVRALLVQKPSLGGVVESTVWVGETYDVIPNEKRRMLAASQNDFLVEVGDVLTADAGPLAPDEPPEHPGEWPTVDEGQATVDLEKED